jgi:hypothetical protein
VKFWTKVAGGGTKAVADGMETFVAWLVYQSKLAEVRGCTPMQIYHP